MIKDYLVYIKHIQDATKNIRGYLVGLDKKEFLKNKMVQDAVIRNIQIIGDAARQIPDEFMNQYQELNWRGMIGARNVVVHEYFRIDLDLVWDVVEKDIPLLEEVTNQILSQGI